MQISRGAIDALGLNGTRDGRDCGPKRNFYQPQLSTTFAVDIHNAARYIAKLRYYIISSKEDYA